MRRPANHALYNKLRPSDVGLEADKPETLKDGESYFATDTYRLYYGGKNGESPFVTKGFPYHLLTQDPNGNDVFRFFVDPVAGNDDNDGQKWSKAKKTLYATLESLPQDLMGNTVRIFLQGGIEEKPYWDFVFNNGNIWVVWCGLFINTNTDSWADFRRGGEQNPIRSNDQFILKGTDETKNTFTIGGDNFKFCLSAKDESIGHWQEGFCYYDRIILEDPDSTTPNTHDFLFLANNNFVELLGVGLKPKGAKSAVVYINSTCGSIAGIRLHDTALPESEAVHEDNNIWRGVFQLRGNHSSERFALGKISNNTGAYIRYDSDFAPPDWDGGASQTLVIDGEVSTLITNGAGPSKSVWVDLDTNDVKFNGVGSNPVIRCSTDFEGTIQYTSAQQTLVDSSTRPRVIKDYTTNIEIVYLTNGIKQAGDDVIFDLPTSDPIVAGALWNDSGIVKVSTG